MAKDKKHPKRSATPASSFPVPDPASAFPAPDPVPAPAVAHAAPADGGAPEPASPVPAPTSAPTPGPAPAPGPERPRVAVMGIGRVERAADVAHATFVAEGTRNTAAEARAVAARTASDVLDALAGAGIAAADMRTAGIDVSPNWDHEGNRPVRRGFTVTNRITTVVRDLEQVGTVLDAALESGASGLDGVSFQLADAAADTTEARRRAVADARARAETIAAAAGCTLGRLVSITEGGAPVPMPRAAMRMAAMADMAGAPPTPVLPGSVEVTVSVTAEWELLED